METQGDSQDVGPILEIPPRLPPDDHAPWTVDLHRMKHENQELQEQLLVLKRDITQRELALAHREADLFIRYGQRSHASYTPYNPALSSIPPLLHPGCEEDGGVGVNILMIHSRPVPTDEDLQISSAWASSGQSDPSVEPHPHSSWYRWFRSTPPDSSSADPDSIVPRQSLFAPDAGKRLPYAIPPSVADILQQATEEAEHQRPCVEQLDRDSLAAVNAPQAGTLSDGSAGDLGDWYGLEIVTLLQAHNLRHCAVTDQEVDAARFYYLLGVKYQRDRALSQTEGIRYLSRTFSLDVKLFPPEARKRAIRKESIAPQEPMVCLEDLKTILGLGGDLLIDKATEMGFNIFPLLQDAIALRTVISQLCRHLVPMGQIDMVVGVETSGCLLGPIVATNLSAAFVPF
ncbi:hypothetical protein LXA43DRAFT_1101895 [Ganoderma leucocontextum]|nr:hypothetical protein LXA43DRAFT_1101895 [Ganoderma leucocontextum]